MHDEKFNYFQIKCLSLQYGHSNREHFVFFLTQIYKLSIEQIDQKNDLF